MIGRPLDQRHLLILLFLQLYNCLTRLQYFQKNISRHLSKFWMFGWNLKNFWIIKFISVCCHSNDDSTVHCSGSITPLHISPIASSIIWYHIIRFRILIIARFIWSKLIQWVLFDLNTASKDSSWFKPVSKFLLDFF